MINKVTVSPLDISLIEASWKTTTRACEKLFDAYSLYWKKHKRLWQSSLCEKSVHIESI